MSVWTLEGLSAWGSRRRREAGGADGRGSGASRRRAVRARARGARAGRAPRRRRASIPSSSKSWATSQTRSSASVSENTRTSCTTSHATDSDNYTFASSGHCSLIEVYYHVDGYGLHHYSPHHSLQFPMSTVHHVASSYICHAVISLSHLTNLCFALVITNNFYEVSWITVLTYD